MNQSHSKNRRIVNIYFLIFAVSGFSGLIYEHIWTQYLKLFLGHAAYAQTIVLILFMGGMAIGAMLIAGITNKISDLLPAYALVEGIIGIFGILFHLIFTRTIDFAFYNLIPQLSSEFTISLVKYGCAVLLVFPQSILLGTTFPLMSGGIIRIIPYKPGRSLAILYFTNSIGAAIGVLTSGFILVPFVGLPGTSAAAGILNILIAVIVLNIKPEKRKAIEKKSIEKDIPSVETKLPQKPVIALLLIAGLTGTASFLYEIGWIRMLSIVLGSSTHAFELMLSAFILGLSIGGYIIRKKIDKLSNPLKTLGYIQIIMGGLALATLVSYNSTFPLMGYAVKSLPKTGSGYLLFNIISHGLSMLIMLPATICAGMTLPLITFILLKKGYGESSIGKVYSSNTIGAIAGVIAAVHWIMPALGLKNVITVGGGIDIAIGILLLFFVRSVMNKKKLYITVSSAVLWLMLCILTFDLDKYKLSSNVYETGVVYGEDQNTEILFHKDGKTSSVDVVKNTYQAGGKTFDGLALSTNGIWIGNQSLDPSFVLSGDNQILLAAIPMALCKNAKSAATFGMGTGLTAHILLTDPQIEKLDVIEIEKEIISGAEFFGEKTAEVFNDPRCNIYVDDAKAFFSASKEKYDIIVADPTYPWVSGVAGLFSTEFYRFISTRITPQGLFVQWIHLHDMDMPLIASVIKALSQNFSDYQIYFTNSNFIAIVAGNNTITGKPDNRIFNIPEIYKELSRIGVLHSEDLYLRKMGNKKMLSPLFDSYPVMPNSDYFPLLDNGAIRARYLKSSAGELLSLRTSVLPVIETITGETPLNISLVSSRPQDKIDYSAMLVRGIYEHCKEKTDPSFNPVINLPQNVLNDLSIMQAASGIKNFDPGLWLQSFERLMTMVLPFVSQEDFELIWSTIQIDINSYFPQKNLDGILFYKMLGMRDYNNIITLIGKNLQYAAVIPDSPNNNLILSSTMLAYLALDKKEQARNLWNRYQNKNNPTVLLRLLSSIINQK